MRYNEYTIQQVDEDWKDYVPGAKTGARVVSAIKGAMDPTKTMAGNYNRTAADQKFTAMAQRVLAAWNQTEQAYAAQGVEEPQMPALLQKWATKYLQVRMPAFPEPMLSDQAVLEYLKKGVAIKWTGQEEPEQPEQPEQDSNAGAAAFGSMASQLQQQPQADQPAPQTQPQQAAQPEAPATQEPAKGDWSQPQVEDPSYALFKDPAAFKAEWDKFIASSPGYRLIADPDLLEALKQMWMRAGGTKVESKKNKGQRV